MKKIVGLFATIVVAIASSIAIAQLYPLFGPSTGILKGSISSPQTSAAASADVIGLWIGGGTCNNTTYLRGDGQCQTPSGSAVGANPTGTVGLTAVNGSATTFLRSDGAPALSQSISPTMTGNWLFAATSGVPVTVTAPTGQNAIVVNPASGSSALTALAGSANIAQVLLRGNNNTGANGFAVLQNASGQAVLNQGNAASFLLQIGGTTIETLTSGGGAQIGAPTGGDQGAGTVNATGVFVNGTAVSTSAASAAGTATASPSAITTTDTYVTPTYTIPANTLAAGSVIRVTMHGSCTSSAANSVNFRMRFGTAGTTADTNIFSGSFGTGNAATSGTNVPFSVTFYFIVITNGSSGTAMANEVLTNNGTTGISQTATFVAQPTVAATINTTVGEHLGISLSAGVATTSISIYMATVERIS